MIAPYSSYNNKQLGVLLKSQGADLKENITKCNEMMSLIMQREDPKLAYAWATIIGTNLESMCDIILNSGHGGVLDSFLADFPEMHDRIYSFISNCSVDHYIFSWISHKPLDSRTILLKKKLIIEDKVQAYINYLRLVYRLDESEAYNRFYHDLDGDTKLGILI